ncbi:MAG: response regulator, partial [Candidatus Hodarchaeota archaeon]
MSRVLLVDDDKILLHIAQEFLKQEAPDLEYITVTSAQEALERLAKEKFDVVVSDYLMRDVNGLDLLQKLRIEGNQIPFIMFTGQGREEVAMQALNLGANHYLMKGVEPKSTFGELAHIIVQLIDHKRTEEALRQSRQLLERSFFTLNEALFVIDADTVRVVDCNPAASRIFGYSREEMIGRTITFLHIDADSLERFREHLYPAIEKEGY